MTAHTTTAQRVAEEAQLLAEERWIVSSLKKIRTQRNCLQIERLQLESMLSQSRCESSMKETIHQQDPEPPKNLNSEQLVEKWYDMKPPSTHVKSLDEDVCNFEELNLSVSTSVFNSENPLDIDDEEEVEAELEEESDSELVIDMHLMMNSEEALGDS